MKFKFMETAEEWLWFKSRTSVILCEDSEAIIAVDDEGEIAAMVVFDTWTPSSVNVHMAVENPMAIKHGIFEQVAIHAYVTRGKKRLFGLVPSNNFKAMKLDMHIGFQEVARVPDAVDDGVDYVIMRLDKEDCRWLPKEHREAA